MQDKISIIVPIYNVEPYLKRCINSLIKQTYQNIEILLVDDCSTDNGAYIAKKYAEKFPNICHFIQREKNGGLSAARNTGIRESTGEWLTFVDSDDWVDKDYLSVMYRTAQQDNADIVMSSVYYYYSKNKCKEVCPFGNLTTKSSHKEKIALCRSYAASRLFKKNLFIETKIMFPEDIWRSEDIATIIPILCFTNKISLVKEPMYYYFQRKSSLSNKNDKNIDISFYPKTVERMLKLSDSKFKKELEFRAITELMYGMTMIMVRSGKSNKEICIHIDKFKKKFPEWKKNTYFPYLAKGKQIFILFAGKKQILLLKILIKIWDIRQKFT